jgi:predicted dehydrogenase
MTDKIRWGILGTGNIAHKFATGLVATPGAQLVAVGSRTAASADKFGQEFNVPHRHASYEALVDDAEVDVVYISTPHPFHKDNSLLCLEAGKAVLCEKPFTMNASEAEELIDVAQEKQLFLMEAMWNRYLPAIVKLRQLLADGAIGEVQMLTADFGFRAGFNPKGRLFDPELGGGALLDAGVYPISFASMLFGTPNRIATLANLGQTGVDEQAGIILGYEAAKMSIIYSAVRIATPSEAIVMGTEGRIVVHAPIYKPTQLTLSRSGQADEILDLPHEGNGYNYEAAEVMACIRAGKLFSELMPLTETLSIMKTMDQIRAQWGLKYPME